LITVSLMFSNLDVDIRPGSGLGIFELGTSLWTVLDTLRGLQHQFPQVDVKYDPDTASTTPVIVHLRPHLDLLFTGTTQRLRTICIRKLRDPNPPLVLRYKNSILSSTEEVLRRVSVSRAFGPTYPGDDLQYPGIVFNFDEDGRHLAEDRMQEVKRVTILQKHLDQETEDPLGEILECPVMEGELALAALKVGIEIALYSWRLISSQIHDGITLHFHPLNSRTLDITIGSTTAQDLLVDLGPPRRTHYKEDERMAIHSKTSNSQDEGSPGCT
jgi:hypothetical protein